MSYITVRGDAGDIEVWLALEAGDPIHQPHSFIIGTGAARTLVGYHRRLKQLQAHYRALVRQRQAVMTKQRSQIAALEQRIGKSRT